MALFTPVTSTRTLNTNFTPSTTRYTLCIYSIQISATASLSGDQNGLVELRSDIASTPTTVRSSASFGVNLTLGMTIGFTNTQTGLLFYIVPPGHNVRLVSTLTGSPTVTLINQTEVTISPEIDPIDFATGIPSR